MLGQTPRRCGRRGLRQDARSCWGCPIRAARSSRSWPSTARPAPSPSRGRCSIAPGLEFSFSGLKTAVLHAVRGRAADRHAARRTSPAACRRPSSRRSSPRRCARSSTTGLDALVVSGGVGANRALRDAPAAAAGARGARVYYPRIEFCTDNAAMIAVAGLARLAGRRSTTVSPSRRARSGRSSRCLRSP